MLLIVLKFQDEFASLQQLHNPNCQDKFQICCIDMYDKISSKFCSIQRVFVNFAAPRPCKTSEALYFDIGDRMKALQTLVTYMQKHRKLFWK